MSPCRTFLPRDVSVAKRLVLVLTVVAAVVTVVFTVLQPPPPSTGLWSLLAIVGPAVVLVSAVAIRVTPEPPAWLWTAFPLSATVLIALSDLATRDASVAAQIFFFFPALYAGAQLRRNAATVLTAAAAAGEVAVTFAGLPPREALANSTYVVAALFTATWLLVFAGERVDALIARLREQAAIDPLTGLVTRRVLDSAATSALRSASADGGTALMLIDLDHFKSVNDVHGHPSGDLVLQQVSEVLHGVGRRTDVVSRMGGDEFAILMPGCPLEAALERAERVVRQVRALRIDVGPVSMARDTGEAVVITPTASVGLAHLPTHADDVHELYRAADESLYRAKRAGRDRFADGDAQAASHRPAA